MMNKYFLAGCLFCLTGPLVLSQPVSNLRILTIPVHTDTVILDTLSLVPGSVLVDGTDSSAFRTDEINALLLWNKNSQTYRNIRSDSVTVTYRVFPLMFSKKYFNRQKTIIEKSLSGMYNPEEYRKVTQGGLISRMEGLSKTGSISRGISFGNNQDVVVNSSLNLQLAGKISEEVEILAAITDNNIPVQPQGNTRQLNDFDKVFIRLSKGKNQLTAGDYELKKPDSYFLHFLRKAQGGMFESEIQFPNRGTVKPVMHTRVAAALGKGRYARNVFNGIEGNQGPYKLKGALNEPFVVVLSGTEKIYIDGQLLQRGQEYDYVIDYNTAELTFTPKVLITKDKRIVAEFEYSDKNYARSLIFLNDEWHTQKLKLRFNLFSEQDSKNQPLLQELNDEQKSFLASLGDSIAQAFYISADSVAFNINEVLYQKIDSGGYVFYRYSTDSLNARFRLTFTDVGQGKGNYVQVRSSANGRVFEWLPPVNGIPQGRFEPVRLLITPRQQQMVTFGATFDFDKTGTILAEGAFSKYDINTFSKTGKANDAGLAFMTEIKKSFTPDSSGKWKLLAGLKAEHTGKNFTPVENYRPVEFTRDWNLSGITVSEDENAWRLTAGVGYDKSMVNYSVNTFQKGAAFRGIMHSGLITSQPGSLKIQADGSYLTTSGTLSKSAFFRSNADVSNTFFRRFTVGARHHAENNRIYAPATDSLTAASFSNRKYSVYFNNGDTGQWQLAADYSLRFDDALSNNDFTDAVRADEWKGALTWLASANSKFSISSHYRLLDILKPELVSLRNDKNIISRIEYNGHLLRSALTVNAYYEAGSGQELKREFTYVKVADGTGLFAWFDYNADGIPQLNEFELAAFKDQANYIRVFTPTNEYIRTRFNQLGFVTGINPAARSQRQSNIASVLSRFSAQFSLRLENKNTLDDLWKGMNPFEINIADTALISSTASSRNTIFYNRTSTVFGMDVSYDFNSGKTLLTNGIESRKLDRVILNGRYNFSRVFGLQLLKEAGRKKNESGFFSERDFDIRFLTSESRFTCQPATRWRLSVLYEYKLKKNNPLLTSDFSEHHKTGAEWKYSDVQKGIITLRFNAIRIVFNGKENSPLAYELLEGLGKGLNFTWGMNIQRTFSGFLQLTLNYEGRKTETSRTVHTGGVELRAFF